MNRHSFLVLIVVMLAGCGRVGYGLQEGPVDGALPMDSGAPVDSAPIVDAPADVRTIVSSVSAAPDARLDREATFDTMASRLPAGLTNLAAWADGTGVYLAGGSSSSLAASSCTRDFVVFDASGAMTTMADELPVANQGLGLVGGASGIYSVMGYCGGSTTEEQRVYRHPMTALPELVGEFANGAYYLSTGFIRTGAGADRIIVAGGFGSGPLRDFIQTMDPADGTAVELTATLPSHRCLAASVSDGDSFYVLGGSTHTNCVPPANSPTVAMTDEVVRIRLDPDDVQVVATLPEPLAAACAVQRADGKFYVFGGLRYVDDGAGGYDRVASDRVYVVDPRTGAAFAHPARLPSPRSQMSCVTTSDQRTLLFGGAEADGTPIDEVLHFEPYALHTELTGTLDAGLDGVAWTALIADTEEPPDTTIRYEIRAADTTATLGGWTEVMPGTLATGAFAGRYLEWRATLGTTNSAVTPILYGIQALFAH